MPPGKPSRPKTREHFEIAIICALTLEADAIIALFDHHWDEDMGYLLERPAVTLMHTRPALLAAITLFWLTCLIWARSQPEILQPSAA
jgi:hypothetical protein